MASFEWSAPDRAVRTERGIWIRRRTHSNSYPASHRRSSVSHWRDVESFSCMQDSEMIAQELSALGHRVDELEKRLAAVEKVNRRLEDAALTTARALAEISGHWDAVYEAMRRKDESQEAPER